MNTLCPHFWVLGTRSIPVSLLLVVVKMASYALICSHLLSNTAGAGQWIPRQALHIPAQCGLVSTSNQWNGSGGVVNHFKVNAFKKWVYLLHTCFSFNKWIHPLGQDPRGRCVSLNHHSEENHFSQWISKLQLYFIYCIWGYICCRSLTCLK